MSLSWTVTFTPSDLGWFEFAVADYVARWGEHWTGKPYLDPEFGPNLAGLPTAVGNMAGTVLSKWVLNAAAYGANDEPVVVFS